MGNAVPTMLTIGTNVDDHQYQPWKTGCTTAGYQSGVTPIRKNVSERRRLETLRTVAS